MSDSEQVYEALHSGRMTARVRKAKRLQEDIETLHNPPEALKEDIAALCKTDTYRQAKYHLERL